MNKERVVFIIGASSGIGYATAKKLVEKGHKVYCGARRTCEIVGVKSFILDVSNPETVKNAVKEIIEENGRLDWLVYSAGFSMASPIEYAKEEDYKYLFEVNFFGALRTLQLVIPHMRRNGYGRIALVGSMGGTIPIPYDAFYSSSKAALSMLARNVNLETKHFDIRCVCVLPGGTATHFTFKRKVYDSKEVGAYCVDFENSVQGLAEIEMSGMKAKSVADTVVKAFNCSFSCETKPSGLMNKLIYVVQKLSPEAFVQWIVRRMYNLK